MHMIMLVQLPIEPFNSAVRDGSLGGKMKRILDATKPQNVWFTEREGHRGAILVVDVDNSSHIPRLAEPWFLEFNATVEFRIAMTPEDLANAHIEILGKQWD